MADTTIFTIGGTVQAGSGIYLSRPADDELFELCRARDFSYVLTSRQMGKSSLMVRTAERLNEAKIRTAIIDLTRLGTNLDAEQWYLGLVYELVEQLDLNVDYRSWWQNHAQLGHTQRLSRFIREVALEADHTPLVIFIDEIDTTLSLPFADDFFAAIRGCYNARGIDSAYKYLAFVLLGVATPSDLIRDPVRTPFNVGQRVDLTDFSLNQALPLADGLGLPPEQARQVLGWVLDWTGGHPYLTQRLCRALVERDHQEWDRAAVTQAVDETFFGERSKQDGNLQFVRDMLTRRSPDVPKVLRVYEKIRSGKNIKNEQQSLVLAHLKISGVVHERNGRLVVRNRIYEQAFNARWVKQSMPSTVHIWITWVAAVFLMVGILIAGYFGYQELTISAATRANSFQASFKEASTPKERLNALANMFNLPGQVYINRGSSLFAKLNMDEKIALFKGVRDSQTQVVVARNIYQRIYAKSDTTETQNEDSLMRAIKEAVKNTDPDLADEIDYWLKGRLALDNQNYYEAINALKSAQSINPRNPALLVDLARAQIGLGNENGYADALQTLKEAAQEDSQRITILTVRRLLDADSLFRAYVLEHHAEYSELAKNVEVLMASIPAGTFQMGSDPQIGLGECNEQNAICKLENYQDEAPIHTVSLNAFEIDIYLVTNSEYVLCVAAGVCSQPANTNSYDQVGYYDDPAFANYPVIYVSWFDANTYCSWRGARLPTEAEWEYAARGGQEGKKYPWGNVFKADHANFCDTNCPLSWADKNLDDGYADTSPVGSYPANAYGLFDMAGNVWEWVNDWYSDTYYLTYPKSEWPHNPTGPENGTMRVIRGGSWYFYQDVLRVSYRNWNHPSLNNSYTGFRCAH